MENLYLYLGFVLSSLVIFFNSIIISYGMKGIDVTEDWTTLKKISVPASISEIGYFIWAYNFLSANIIILIFLISITGLILKKLKFEGYKFIISVMTPLAESLVILYGLSELI